MKTKTGILMILGLMLSANSFAEGKKDDVVACAFDYKANNQLPVTYPFDISPIDSTVKKTMFGQHISVNLGEQKNVTIQKQLRSSNADAPFQGYIELAMSVSNDSIAVNLAHMKDNFWGNEVMTERASFTSPLIRGKSIRTDLNFNKGNLNSIYVECEILPQELSDSKTSKIIEEQQSTEVNQNASTSTAQ